MNSLSRKQVNKYIILLIIMSMFVCLSIIGCSCGKGSDVVPTPYFPVRRNPGFTQLETRIEGRLVTYEGCLRLKPFFGKSYMIIWPYGYKLRLEDKTIQVHNADDQAVACVGDWIVLGGGVTDSTEFIENIIVQPLPPDCNGPYWIAGTITD
jgi:hypothetical protein